jgi:hypothetical protein
MATITYLPLSILDRPAPPRRMTITSWNPDRLPDTPAGYRAVAYGKLPGTNFRVCTFERIEEASDDRR